MALNFSQVVNLIRLRQIAPDTIFVGVLCENCNRNTRNLFESVINCIQGRFIRYDLLSSFHKI